LLGRCVTVASSPYTLFLPRGMLLVTVASVPLVLLVSASDSDELGSVLLYCYGAAVSR
jgi:hypothetical protein